MTYLSVFQVCWCLIIVLTVGREQGAVSLCTVNYGQNSSPSPNVHVHPTLTATMLGPMSITITWSQLSLEVERYHLQYTYQGPCSVSLQQPSFHRSIMFNHSVTVYRAMGLSEFSKYTFTVAAVSSNTILMCNESANFTTLPAAPSGPPQSLMVTSTTPSSVTIQWDEVECLQQNSEITGYSVRYGEANGTGEETVDILTGADNRTFNATGLIPSTMYIFRVAAVSDNGTGPCEDKMVLTAAIPGLSTTARSPTTTTDEGLNTSTPLFTSTDAGQTTSTDAGQNTSTDAEANSETASSLSHTNTQSAATTQGTAVTVKSREGTFVDKGLVVGIALAVVMFLITIGIAIAVTITVWRLKKKRKHTIQCHENNQHSTYKITALESGSNDYYIDSMVPNHTPEVVELTTITSNNSIDETDHVESQPDDHKAESNEQVNNPIQKEVDYSRDIPVTEFGQHVARMHSENDNLFEVEYKTLNSVPTSSHEVAAAQYNKVRNRFANIHPYDFSRVVLQEIPGEEGSDYINASYIDGSKKPKAYIAAQGPKPNTLTDFWRMIWEYKLPTVIMLTRCFEGRKKCEAYWPENVNETIEPGQDLMVSLVTQLDFAEYAVRTMRVNKTSDPSPPLEVTQFHFLGWPDHGVPSNAMTVINFIRRVRKTHPFSDERHLLVHCSAGVGRTGTFIVLDTMLERMKVEDTVNIYETVKQLRIQRPHMVQTQPQYAFIHDALNELIICGETEISAGKLRATINELKVVKEEEKETTGFEEQFKILEELSPKFDEENYSQATNKYNINKNRYHNILPHNSGRVYLRSSFSEGSDYINASFIDGYKRRGAYIATQGPLESTVRDFWRMLLNYKSTCIVMLCDLEEDGEESSHCYWPTTEESSKTYDTVEVSILSEDKYEDYIVRKFEVKEERPQSKFSSSSFSSLASPLTVTQFQFLRWPKHSPPDVTSSLLELMENVNKVQMNSGNKAITVMCNDGVGRSGTFICINSQLERLKTEGVVDLFQTIKSGRTQRAGLVTELAQYQLCHEVLANYLDSFETYANFKE